MMNMVSTLQVMKRGKKICQVRSASKFYLKSLIPLRTTYYSQVKMNFTGAM